MTDTSVKRVKLYLNGDPNFNGKTIVVNPRYYRNFESFLDTATWTTHSTCAVTRICTPQGRHTIDSVEKLSNGANYVAVGRERFKKLKYGEAKLKSAAVKMPSVWRSQLPSSGRFLKVYEGEKQALKRIYVYRNGDNKTPARMVLLKKRTLTDMELVLAALQDCNMSFDFAVSKLFTLSGKQVYSCDEIIHNGKYVAIQRGSRFKPINYDNMGSLSPRNPVAHFTRLPPLPTARSNQSKASESSRKNPPLSITHKFKLPPTKDKTKQADNKSEKIVVTKSLPKQESILSSFDDNKRESFSHVSLSVTPPPLDESPDFSLEENIERTNKTKDTVQERGSFAIPNDLDKLPDQQKESIGLKLYNASGMQREWGNMVVENQNTVTEKLIDDIPAEEIADEDISESAEEPEENTTITEKVIDAVKDKLIDDSPAREIIDEDDTENIEDAWERITSSESESSENNDDGKENEERKIIEEVPLINGERDEREGKEESSVEEIKDEEEPEKSEEDDELSSSSAEVPMEEETGQRDDQRSEEHERENHEESREGGDGDDNGKEVDEQEDADESPLQSRNSSQDMDSEDEIRSEDEEQEDNDNTDDRQSNDDEPEDNTSGKKDNESNDTTSISDQQQSEKDDDSEADEPATKENKTNERVEEQRADPEAAKKKEIKENDGHIKYNKKRIDNKA